MLGIEAKSTIREIGCNDVADVVRLAWGSGSDLEERDVIGMMCNVPGMGGVVATERVDGESVVVGFLFWQKIAPVKAIVIPHYGGKSEDLVQMIAEAKDFLGADYNRIIATADESWSEALGAFSKSNFVVVSRTATGCPSGTALLSIYDMRDPRGVRRVSQIRTIKHDTDFELRPYDYSFLVHDLDS